MSKSIILVLASRNISLKYSSAFYLLSSKFCTILVIQLEAAFTSKLTPCNILLAGSVILRIFDNIYNVIINSKLHKPKSNELALDDDT